MAPFSCSPNSSSPALFSPHSFYLERKQKWQGSPAILPVTGSRVSSSAFFLLSQWFVAVAVNTGEPRNRGSRLGSLRLGTSRPRLCSVRRTRLSGITLRLSMGQLSWKVHFVDFGCTNEACRRKTSHAFHIRLSPDAILSGSLEILAAIEDLVLL